MTRSAYVDYDCIDFIFEQDFHFPFLPVQSFLEGSLKETEERRNALEEEKAKTEKQAEELRSNMLGKVEGFGAMLEEMKKSLDVLEGQILQCYFAKKVQTWFIQFLSHFRKAK